MKNRLTTVYTLTILTLALLLIYFLEEIMEKNYTTSRYVYNSIDLRAAVTAKILTRGQAHHYLDYTYYIGDRRLQLIFDLAEIELLQYSLDKFFNNLVLIKEKRS